MLKVTFHVRNARTGEERDVMVMGFNEDACRENLVKILRARGARDLDLLDTRIVSTKVEVMAG